MKAGRVDVAWGGEVPVFFGISNGAPVVLLAGGRSSATGQSRILVKDNSPIHTVADLRGTKIAMPLYTVPHYPLAVALQQAGLAWSGTAAGAADIAEVLVLLVGARLANAEPDLAAQTAQRLVAFAATRPTDYVAAQSATAAAHLAVSRGDLDEATLHFQTAWAIFTRLGLPLDAGQVNLASARAHAPSSPQLAVAEAGAAPAVFDQVGATVLADAAAALLRSLGVARRSIPRSGTELTRREQEVMHLVGLGLSNPEIAQRLFISRKAAAHHVSSVLGKLGLRNRAEAVAHVARLADHHRSS